MRLVLILTLTCLCAESLTRAVTIVDAQIAKRGETPGGIDAVPFETAANDGIVVEARLNRRGPFRLLLDTGSSHSAIAADVAKSLDAMPVGRVVIQSPIGESVRTVVQIDRVEIGPSASSNILASVIPAEAAARLRGFHGLIGQDVLANKRYTIDFRRRRLLWYEQDSAITGQALPLEFDNGHVLVTLPQPAAALRLVPDSAAPELVLFSRPNLTLPAWSGSGTEAELATLVERRNARQVILNEFRIGTSILLRVPATIVPVQPPAPADDSPRCDGLLPLHLFDRVTFDVARQLMIVEGRRALVGRTD